MKTILVVDDHESIRKGIKILFEARGRELGYTVHEAGNGKEALVSVANSRPDVAIVDLMMPEMDGFSLSGELRKQYPNLPIVILTAKTDPTTEAKINGVAGDNQFVFMTKPVDNTVLYDQVTALISGSSENPS